MSTIRVEACRELQRVWQATWLSREARTVPTGQEVGNHSHWPCASGEVSLTLGGVRAQGLWESWEADSKIPWSC